MFNPRAAGSPVAHDRLTRTEHTRLRVHQETHKDRLTATENHPGTLSRPHSQGTQRFGGTNWLEGGTAEMKGTVATLPVELA